MNTIQTSNLTTVNSQKIYNTAASCLNQNLHGSVDAEVGCAATVSEIFKRAGVPLAYTPSTAQLYTELQDMTRFKRVNIPQAGDVIISPTGHGNGTVEGHTGIVAFYGILSNNSDNGLLQERWTFLADWIARYAGLGGLPVEFYRAL